MVTKKHKKLGLPDPLTYLGLSPKFYPFFVLPLGTLSKTAYWIYSAKGFFDTKNTFYGIVRGLKNAFLSPFLGCQNEGPACCK